MGKIIGYKHGESSIKGVDPRLWDIVQHAIAASPYDAQIRSGHENRGAGEKGNHGGGYAIDVTLVDPQTHEKLPDKASANKGATFAAYEQYAQAARVYQQQTYPELNKTFRWGGGFSQGGTPGDLMHLDITPHAKGAMAFYNWDTGLNSDGKAKFPKAQSNGGLAGESGTRLVAQYQQSLAGSGGLVPPADIKTASAAIDNSFPRPMPSSIAAAYAEQPRALGGSFAGLGPDAMNGIGRVGAGGTRVNPSEAAASGRTALDEGFGALSDPRTASLTTPRVSGLTALGAANGNSGSNGGAGLHALGRIGASGQAAAVPQSIGAGGSAALKGSTPDGMIAPGNIDLKNRPVYFGNDGSYGTERSFSIGTDKGEVLLPQIINGKLVSQDEAIKHYQQTGENMGTFSSPEAADAYAQKTHERDQGLGKMPVPMSGRPSVLQASPAASVATASHPMATVTPESLSFKLDPEQLLVMAKQSPQYVSAPGFLRPSDDALLAMAKDALPGMLPAGITYDPTTQVFHVKDAQTLHDLIAHPPIDKATGKPVDLRQFMGGVAKPIPEPTQTFPLPIPRPGSVQTPAAPVPFRSEDHPRSNAVAPPPAPPQPDFLANVGKTLGSGISSVSRGLGAMFGGGDTASRAGGLTALGSANTGATALGGTMFRGKAKPDVAAVDSIGLGPSQNGLDAMTRTYQPAPVGGYYYLPNDERFRTPDAGAFKDKPVRAIAAPTEAQQRFEQTYSRNLYSLPKPSMSPVGSLLASGAAGAAGGVGGTATLAPKAVTAPIVPPSPVRVATAPKAASGGGGAKSAPAPAATFKGSSTGRTYTVGATYSNKDGSFKAQADGSFKKVA